MSRACRATIGLAAGLASLLVLPARTQSPSLPGVDVRIARAGASDRQRVQSAIDHAMELYAAWLGPPPGGVRIAISPPWWPAPATMDVESQVAFELARLWLKAPASAPGAGGERSRAAMLADGAAWYLQSRVVEDLFDYAFLRTAHSADGVRLFGGAVPWPVPSLRLSRWTAGLGREEFLRAHSGSSALQRLPAGVTPAVARAALAFGTLERYLGWPALQGALDVWARRAAEGELTREEIEQTIEAATAQDLAWFFSAAFDVARRYDYAVSALSSERAGPRQCDPDPCFLTAVTAERLGDAVFSGSSREPVGEFESGDALEVRVAFADGRQASARWDGRQASKTLVFESQAPAVAAEVDPGGVLLLDENRLNNVRRLTRVSNVPTRRWVVRWMVWLEDAMLGALAVLGT